MRVVMVGGGFGGLEAAFNLRLLAGEGPRMTLISDQDHFLFKPNSIYVPFGLDPEKLKVPLTPPTKRRDIEFVSARVTGIDATAGSVETSAGSFPYDRLVIATGADMRASEVPGLAEHAISTWTPDDMLRLRSAFDQLAQRRSSGRKRVLFLVPPNNKCAAPLYEIVLMLETWLRRKHSREGVEIDHLDKLRGHLHPGFRAPPPRGRRRRVRAAWHRGSPWLGCRERQPELRQLLERRAASIRPAGLVSALHRLDSVRGPPSG